MTELTIDGDPFHVVVEGDAARPSIVLSNSLGTSLAMWDAQMPALLQHFRVVRYDSRGHGASVVGDRPYSIDRLGRDVIAILDALEIDRVHFLGLSMGGAVGQWLLVNAPERIDRAILANTAARLGSAAGWNARIEAVLAGRLDENAKATVERWFSPAFAEAHPEIVATFEAGLRQVSPQGYAFSCAALRDMDLRSAVRDVQHPVLVISGAHDPVTGEDDIAHLAALPNARHIVLPTRHISNVEAPGEFDRAVVEFLTRSDVVRGARRVHPAPLRKPRRAGRRDAGRTSIVARKAVANATARRRPSAKATVATQHGRKGKASAAKTSTAKASTATASTAKRSSAKPTTTRTAARKVSSAPARRKGQVQKAASAATAKRAISPAKAKPSPKVLAAAKPGATAPRRKAVAAPRRAKAVAPTRRPTSAAAARVGKAAATRTSPNKATTSKIVAPSQARTIPRGKAAPPPRRTKAPTRRTGAPATAARGGRTAATKAAAPQKPATKRVSPKQVPPNRPKPPATRRKPPAKPRKPPGRLKT